MSGRPAQVIDGKQKQSTLNGFFTKKPGPAPSRPSSSASNTAAAAPLGTSSPASTALRTPCSVTGSSPADRLGTAKTGKERARASSPLKKGSAADDVQLAQEKEGLSPPPMIRTKPVSAQKMVRRFDSAEDLEVPLDGSPPISSGRRPKRKVIYAESDDSGSDTGFAGPFKSSGPARKPRKSLKAASDDDDFHFDDADDALFAAVAEDYENGEPSPSPSSDFETSASTSRQGPPKKQKAPAKKAFVPPQPTRPGPRPVPSSTTNASRGESSRSIQNSSDMFLTNAEIRKRDDKEAKEASDDIFAFLKNVRDKQKRTPEDPDYDPRTIYIPKADMERLKPFEKQFWTIKQNHYDTVLFFQKGKFYELYEDDARIGHQEFDLKLTDRVRMKMVGVPEQSFDFWAAKFLAAGYKVGRVDQAETAIGAEMRKAAEKSGTKSKKKTESLDDNEGQDKIVRRELKQVFTNGTIVDGAYLTTDEANHCVAIKEYSTDSSEPSSFGICVLDASTGEFNLSAFDDDVCRTRLETMFRQIRPKELIHCKGNLSVSTTRTLRNILPSSTLWQSFRPIEEFYTAETTLQQLGEIFETEEDEPGSKPALLDTIVAMLEKPLALEALGGMIFYLKTLNLDKDLITQRNFNVYDPIRNGKNLVLDGQTLAHMEVLVNNEGGLPGTLLELLQLCITPFGKRLFRLWLSCPLREITAINDRLDAVEDLMTHHSFTGEFSQMAKTLPDLERLISRIHAGSVKQTDFSKVVDSFEKIAKAIEDLGRQATDFDGKSVNALLRSAPDLQPHMKDIRSRFRVHTDDDKKSFAILPKPGRDEECDEADEVVAGIEVELDRCLELAQRVVKGSKKEPEWWHGQGGKEIYQIQVSADAKVPNNWTKQSGTKNFSRYYTPDTVPLIRQIQEAREIQATAKRGFFLRLLAEFDKDRTVWLEAVKMVAELDCLVSLAKASANMDEPKCRPTFVESDTAFVDFEELRHPSMCLRADFIANDVRLGGKSDSGVEEPRQVLLTGPNMAGKSTLLRMTAAGIIMAQMGCYVPAAKATLGPVDKIQTRMGAYDNMFASASTFKVELDECSKILREAGPKSFVILDELGRGTSTYDGMAIAGAVLHHLATHTLPLGFFATHYGSLTDDFAYHPNIRNMHMQTHVDDEQMQVVFLYKLIPGVAESSHGTHVARLAGVPETVVSRADQVSAEFFEAFKTKLAAKRRSDLPLVAHADFAWLMSLLSGSRQGEDHSMGQGEQEVKRQLDVVKRAIERYAISA